MVAVGAWAPQQKNQQQHLLLYSYTPNSRLASTLLMTTDDKKKNVLTSWVDETSFVKTSWEQFKTDDRIDDNDENDEQRNMQ